MSGTQVLYVKDRDTGDFVPVDGDFRWNALTTIDNAHRRVHLGQSFFGGHMWGDVSRIVDNGNADLLLRIGGTPMHVISHVAADGTCEVRYYEGVTVSADGTVAISANKNRLSSKTPDGGALYYGPTVTDTGTELPPVLLPGGYSTGGGGGNVPAGGFNGSYDSEVIMKANTDYLIRVTNRSNQAAAISINVSGYGDFQ